jgi:hypothetical protein
MNDLNPPASYCRSRLNPQKHYPSRWDSKLRWAIRRDFDNLDLRSFRGGGFMLVMGSEMRRGVA